MPVLVFCIYLYAAQQTGYKKPGKAVSYLILISIIGILIFTSNELLRIFYGLVINSKISFDVNNVLNLSGFSFIGVLLLCFSFLMFFLLSEIALTICFQLDISLVKQSIVFIAAIVIATGVTVYYWEFSLYNFLWMPIILIRGYAYRYDNRRFSSMAFICIILICTIISAIKLNHFEHVREEGLRKVLIQKLEMPDDAIADGIFKNIEKDLSKDSLLVSYFKSPNRSDDYLETRLKKIYFDQYLSKYDFKVHGYDKTGYPISVDKSYSLDVFKDMVVYSSFKVSDYFYRENESFGFQSYFAILPVLDNDNNLGTVVIELKSKPLLLPGSFPDLLIDKQVKGNKTILRTIRLLFTPITDLLRKAEIMYMV
ncbi:MAG: hypothetical protein JKY70_22100 [Mucilaginibacter sp.]|nr:hypothetical protein [Mucilaginibacter sp.]